MTQCNLFSLQFQHHNRRMVTANFDGGHITSEGGAILLREFEKKTRILEKFAGCFTDYRDPNKTEHTPLEMISQRVYGIILGYSDLNDHDQLRKDVMFSLLSGKADLTGQNRRKQPDKGNALAGKSTLNRLELTPEHADTNNRYKKISYDKNKINDLFIELFLDSYPQAPSEIILDCDATDDPLHGHQECRFFHGYYHRYCYMPLYIFAGDHLLCSRLRPSNIDACDGVIGDLSLIVEKIRTRWSDVRIIVRGDAGFCREEIMKWCEDHHVFYIFGLAKNDRLKRKISKQMEHSKRKYLQTGKSWRSYRNFYYKTRKSWTRKRRVVGKAEYMEKGVNPRFVVTNLSRQRWATRQLYEKLYCARGDMENRIKEQQLDLFADRTSTSLMRSNQLRLYFSSMAYIISSTFRRIALQTGAFAKLQCGTIRNKLFKIGAVIKISFRRITILFAGGYPYKTQFIQSYKNINCYRC